MGVQLLLSATANTVSLGFDVSPAKNMFGATVICTGQTGDKVLVEVSGTVSLNDWQTLGTVTIPGIQTFTGPVERVRCTALGTNTGTVTAIYEPGV